MNTQSILNRVASMFFYIREIFNNKTKNVHYLKTKKKIPKTPTRNIS